MAISWSTIFELVNRMWGLNQNAIANHLQVDPSIISKLKNNKQFDFQKRTNAEIYKLLFDPANPHGPVYSEDSRKLLREMRDELREMGFADAIKTLSNDNYERFVMGLLRLVRENVPKPSTKKGKLVHNATENAKHSSKSNQLQPAIMLDEFYNSFEEQGVGAFIDSNPADSLPSFRIKDAIAFVGHIKHKHAHENSPDKKENIYKDIMEFTETLEKYIEFLVLNSSDAMSYTNWNFSTPLKYDSPNCNSDEFKSKTDQYHRQLNMLYQIIKAEYEQKQNKYKEKLRDINRQAGKNANAGTLYNIITDSIDSNQNSDV